MAALLWIEKKKRGMMKVVGVCQIFLGPINCKDHELSYSTITITALLQKVLFQIIGCEMTESRVRIIETQNKGTKIRDDGATDCYLQLDP